MSLKYFASFASHFTTLSLAAGAGILVSFAVIHGIESMGSQAHSCQEAAVVGNGGQIALCVEDLK